MKNRIKTVLSDFWKNPLPKYKKRNFVIPLSSQKIISLIGARRTGKTTIFYQIIDELLESGVKKENIIFLNFEDDRLRFSEENLTLVVEAYLEIFPETKMSEVYFFLDEVQNVKGWESFVRRVYDTLSQKIFITGSSAKLLSKEIATNLRGRALSFEVFPLSFAEYVQFNTKEIHDIYTTQQKALFINLFRKYIQNGGFPETVLLEDENIWLKILQNYAEVMLYRDIVERYKIKNIVALKIFIQKNIGNIAKESSIFKTFNELKSAGIKITKDTLYQFAVYAEDAYYLFFLPSYNASLQEQNIRNKKVYSIDTGLANASSFRASEDAGRQLENLVFLQLRRQEKTIFYHKQKKECDFIVQEKLQITEVYQVSHSVRDPKTREREIEGLLDAMNAYDLRIGYIITEEEEEEILLDNKKILIFPFWKWAVF